MSSLVLKLLVSLCFRAAPHVSNLAWQNRPRVNGRFIARSIPSPTLNTPTISRTPSTVSSLERSPSPDGFDLGNTFNNSSPPTSPPLQPTLPPVAPITPITPVTPVAPRRATMPSNNVNIFYGDGQEGENPQNFLCAFHREMRSLATTNDKDIARAFVDYLGASSQADLWFDDLTQTTQESWAQLETAFVARWPQITQAKRSEQEIERELLSTLFNEKELGEKSRSGELTYGRMSHGPTRSQSSLTKPTSLRKRLIYGKYETSCQTPSRMSWGVPMQTGLRS